MLNSINTIQNKKSFEEFINHDYIEAITNSGQRIGVAGHSIKYKTENIFEILDGLAIDVTNASDYAVLFEFANSSYNYYTYKISDGTKNFIGTTNDNKILSQESEVANKIVEKLLQLGRIENISNDYILHYDNHILTFIFKAKVLSTNNDAEYYYLQYDTIKNVIKHFILIKKYDENNCILFKLDENQNEYTLSAHKFDIDSLELYIKQIYKIQEPNISLNIKSMFDYDTSIDNGFSIINADFIDYDKLCSNEYVFSESSIVQFVLNFSEENKDEEDTNIYHIYHFENLPITYNKENDLSFSFGSDDSDTTSINKLKGENGIEISEVYDFIFYSSVFDISYEYLLNTYNKYYYTESKNKLFLAIIRELYNTINSNVDESKTQLWIPGSYTFNYICSDDNELEIFFFNNVDVLYVNDTVFTSDILKTNFIVYYNNAVENKLVNYQVGMKYNSEFFTIVEEINIKKLYTYPYINQMDTWMVNDEDTKISSYNNLSSIHKMFVIYVDDISNISADFDSYAHVVNHLTSDDYKYFTFTQRTFALNPQYCSLYDTTVKCKTLIPKILNTNTNYFKNTTLLVVTNKNNIDEQINIDNYNGNYVYSIWTYNNDTNNFEYIKDPVSEKYALDPFGYVLEHSVNNDNILYINARTSLVGQNQYNVNGNNYAVIRNKTAKNYSTEYNNDFNFIIEYVNYLQESGNNIDYTKVAKFVNDISTISTSNKLYPRYNKTIVYSTDTNTYYSTVDELRTLINNGYTVKIDKDNNILTEAYITQTTKNVSHLIEQEETYNAEVKYTIVNKSEDTYYNEYLPNNNVPLFDSKEILHVNTSILNRANIIGIDNGYWYNAFIGTYYDNTTSKAVLGISTSSTNINVGTDTLFDNTQATSFNKFKTFKISEFENIEFESTNNIQINQNISQIHKFDSAVIKSSSLLPMGFMADTLFSGELSDNVISLVKENNNPKFKLYFPNIEQLSNSSVLFVKLYYYDETTFNLRKYDYVCNCIYLNNLLKNEFNLSDNIVNNLAVENLNVGNNIVFSVKTNSAYNVVTNHLFMIINCDDFDNFEYIENGSTKNITILNTKLNVINKDNSNYNIRFNDVSLNTVTSNNLFVDLTQDKYVSLSNLLEHKYENTFVNESYNYFIKETKYEFVKSLNINITY